MKKLPLLLLLVSTLLTGNLFAQPDAIPNREPGKCYAKSMIPDEYATQTETVVVKEATSKIDFVPAIYATQSEQVLAKAASTRIEKQPALYTTTMERFRVGCPEGYMDGLAEGGSGVDECYRMIAVPATYKSVTEVIITKEASTQIITEPAVYKDEAKIVVVKEASTRLEIVPAEYETRTVSDVLIEAATERMEVKPVPYQTVTEVVVVKPATTEWQKIKADKNCLSDNPEDCMVWQLVEVPAQVRKVEKQVMGTCENGWTQVGEDCTRTIAVPAKFGSRKEDVLVKPASVREIQVPEETKTIVQKVLVRPASQRMVQVPAEAKSYTRQVIDTPATTRKETIEPIYEEYQRMVRTGCPQGFSYADPERPSDDCVRVLQVPAEYTTQNSKIVQTPSSTRITEVPAEMRTIEKQVLVKQGGHTAWKEVVCEGEVTPQLIRRLQQALINRGYDLGPAGADNVMGKATKNALIQYQKDNQLPYGNIDYDTLTALGINP